MSEPIILYSNGEVIVSDSSILYEPFPESSEKKEEEKDSQDLQMV